MSSERSVLERQIIETCVELRRMQLRPEVDPPTLDSMWGPIDYAGTVARWKDLLDRLIDTISDKSKPSC